MLLKKDVISFSNADKTAQSLLVECLQLVSKTKLVVLNKINNTCQTVFTVSLNIKDS